MSSEPQIPTLPDGTPLILGLAEAGRMLLPNPEPTNQLLRALLQYSVPASATPEGKERLRAYHEALGRFVHEFARAETAVALTLRKYAGTKTEVAKVIFASTKIDVGSTQIKQIALATGAPKGARDDLEYVLQQLGIINGARNAILHYGAELVAEGTAFVSDAIKAKGEPTVFPISPTALNQMSHDANKIVTHLNFRHLGRPLPKGDHGLSELRKIFDAPWQYKHPTPPRLKTTKAESRRSRKRGSKLPRQHEPS